MRHLLDKLDERRREGASVNTPEPFERRFADFLSGDKLWGDSFDEEELRAWFADEAAAYADLASSRPEEYQYDYSSANEFHLFRQIAHRRFRHALALGGAWGHDVVPLEERSDRITVVEPEISLFQRDTILQNARYVQASWTGDLPIASESVDVVVVLGTLHHIANVSHVIAEVARVCMNGGVLLLREPVVSMGAWDTEREGLTRRERGIPRSLLLKMLAEAGFSVSRAKLIGFAPLVAGCAKARIRPFRTMGLTRVDSILSSAFAWNYRYHSAGVLEKFRPTSLAVVATKQT